MSIDSSGVQIDKKMSVEKTPHMPSLAEITGRVRSYNDPTFNKDYQLANKKFYDLSQSPPVRTGLMEHLHPVTETGQVIYNIGTAHDWEPDSKQMKQLRNRVTEYIAHTPKEKQYFILEGFNLAEGISFPEDVTNQFRQQPGESEEEAYVRVVGTFGEIGLAYFYALKEDSEVDYQSEISPQGEFEALQKSGIPLTDIAAILFPKHVDFYKTGSEFKPDDVLSQDSVFEALSRLVDHTGWKREEFVKVITSGRLGQKQSFIESCLSDLNAVMQKEIGKDIISLDYKPAFKYANEFAQYRQSSKLINSVFTITGDTRDIHIAKETYTAVQKGKSPFLLFGDSHTFKVEPALASIAVETKKSTE